ncbi:hypothetical protein LTR86_006380 [Recurvomyces mirabilis]|nr:hypothetical protein LTR86_006380 [Recurvomyces mirabilis]
MVGKAKALPALVTGATKMSTEDTLHTSHTTATPATNTNISSPKCYFFTLPRELRDEIYHLVALDAVGAHLRERIAPPLLATNRQVRHEFEAVYYSDKTMTYVRLEGSSDEKRIVDWIQVSDPLSLSVMTRAQTVAGMSGSRY